MIKATYSNRRAHALCEMSHKERLDFIAEGLPIILKSAQGFWNASRQIDESPREAGVLVGFAEEEAAKVLILLDLVRCPSTQVSRRVGHIVKRVFYDHLARLIYAEAQSWKPLTVIQLQEYVDTMRQSHCLDGVMSEYITPNWALYSRESAMYADVEIFEDGKPKWNDPQRWSETTIGMKPISLQIAESLNAFGIFSRAGVQATAEVWGMVNFVDSQGHKEARQLTQNLSDRLNKENLFTASVRENDLHTLYNIWQMPMYSINFSRLSTSLQKLKDEQETAYWDEFGQQYYADY